MGRGLGSLLWSGKLKGKRRKATAIVRKGRKRGSGMRQKISIREEGNGQLIKNVCVQRNGRGSDDRCEVQEGKFGIQCEGKG